MSMQRCISLSAHHTPESEQKANKYVWQTTNDMSGPQKLILQSIKREAILVWPRPQTPPHLQEVPTRHSRRERRRGTPNKMWPIAAYNIKEWTRLSVDTVFDTTRHWTQ